MLESSESQAEKKKKREMDQRRLRINGGTNQRRLRWYVLIFLVWILVGRD
jgi:hypothetical protein